MKVLLGIGVLLLVVSAPPLLLMGREVAIQSGVHDRYAIEPIPSGYPGMESNGLQAEIGGHSVRLEDDQPPTSDPEARATATVRILIDGRDYSNPTSAKIRPFYRDDNRYWGYVHLTKLVDRHDGATSLVVAQSLDASRYRVLTVDADGRVADDRFEYSERCSAPVRALLIREVTPHPVGYCSDLMQVWPSLFYPVLFPWASGVVGFGCAAVASGTMYWRRRRTKLSGRQDR